MKKYTDRIRVRQNSGDEPALTTVQLNAAVRQFDHLPTMLVEELMSRVSEEDLAGMEPYLTDISRIFSSSIGQCYYNPAASNPHPETFTELRERFADGEEKIIGFLQYHGANLNDGAQVAFKAAYKQICHRLENAMMGQSISTQAGQYMMQ